MANPRDSALQPQMSIDTEPQQVASVRSSLSGLAGPAENHSSVEESADREQNLVSSSSPQPTWCFADMANPGTYDIECVFVVDNGPIWNYPEAKPFLEIDCGIYGSPCIGLRFIGHDSVELGQTHWGIADVLKGNWLIRSLAIEFVKDQIDDSNSFICHPDAIKAFPDVETQLHRLICITVDVFDGRCRHCDPNMEAKVPQEGRRSFETIFEGSRSYVIRIWFMIPQSFPDMNYRCLQVLLGLMSQRIRPLSPLLDRTGFPLRDDPLEEDPW